SPSLLRGPRRLSRVERLPVRHGAAVDELGLGADRAARARGRRHRRALPRLVDARGARRRARHRGVRGPGNGAAGTRSSRSQTGYEAADELRDRAVVEDEVEKLALEAARHLAPVAPHGLEPDDLERLARGSRHQPRVALLAARRAAADLRHEEARVDLLELEL